MVVASRLLPSGNATWRQKSNCKSSGFSFSARYGLFWGGIHGVKFYSGSRAPRKFNFKRRYTLEGKLDDIFNSPNNFRDDDTMIGTLESLLGFDLFTACKNDANVKCVKDLYKYLVNSRKDPSAAVHNSLNDTQIQCGIDLLAEWIATGHTGPDIDSDVFEGINDGVENLEGVPRGKLKHVAAEMWKHVASGCKTAYVTLGKWTQALCKCLFSQSLKDVLLETIHQANWNLNFTEPNVVAKFFELIKPTALVIILQQHHNTQSGWIVTLTALAELYGGFDTIGKLLKTVLLNAVELLQSGARVLDDFVQWTRSHFVAESVEWTWWIAIPLVLLYILLDGRNSVSWFVKKILKFATGMTTVGAAVSMISRCMSYLRDRSFNEKVDAFMTRCAGLMDVIDMHRRPGTVESEGLLACIEILVSEGLEVIAIRPTSPLAALVRTAVTELREKARVITTNLKMDRSREAPIMLIFSGAPGVGKSRLIDSIARAVAPHSNLNFHVDHHDAYTGNPIALWDEFDTDPNCRFLEATIGMVNTTAYTMNCDRIENKGQVFSSSVILATTNSDTPVNPENPRAEAFYRRVVIIDVDNPGLTKFRAANPGKQPPKSCYSDDFTHLSFKQRPYLGYDRTGRVLGNAGRIAPTPTTYHEILEKVKRRVAYEAEGNDAPQITILTQDHLLERVVSTCKGYLKFVRSPAYVTTDREDWGPLRGYGTGRFLVTTSIQPDDPNVAKVVDVREFRDQVGPWGQMYKCNSLFDCFVTTQRPNGFVERNVTYQVIGISAVAGMNVCPITPRAVVNVVTPHGLFPVLYRHAGLVTAPSLVKLLWKGMRGRSYHDLLLDACHTLRFPNNPEITLIRTPMGDHMLYTCGGALIMSTPARFPIYDPNAFADPRLKSAALNSSWFDVLLAMCEWVLKFLSIFATTGLAMHNLCTLALREKTVEEGKGKNKRGKGRKIALRDDEYDEWQDVKRDWKMEITAEEFLAMRQRAAVGMMDPTSQRFRAWYNLRGTRQAAGAYHTVIGKGGTYTEFVDEGASHIVQMSFGPNHMGWAVRIGPKRAVTSTHVAKASDRADGKPFQLCEQQYDTAVILLESEGPYKSIGKGEPVYFKDTYNAVRVLERGKFETHTNTLDGWSVKISGTTTAKGYCGLPYYNNMLQLVGLHSATSAEGTVKIVSSLEWLHKDSIKNDTFAWKGLTVTRGPDVGGSQVGTKYHRSPAHPVPYDWETHAPAPFGRGDKRYTFSTVQMLVNNLQPYQFTPHKFIDPNLLSRAMSHLSTCINFAIGPHTSKNLTKEQAIDCLDFSTSGGPYVPGLKRDYLDDNGNVTGALKERIDNVWTKMNSGEDIQQVYKMALKDELRPVEKNKQGKRRLLWGADAGLVVAANAVFKPVADRLQQMVPLTPVCVGVNMDSPIIETMNAALVGKILFNVDYSKWDSTMQPQIINAAVNFLSRYCEPTPLTAAVVKTLCSPPIAAYDDVRVQANTGLPSGMPFTSVIKSICHSLLIACAILKVYELNGLPYSGCVFSNEVIYTYGDDGVYAFCTATASLFQQIVEQLKAFGLNPTAADKSSDIRPTVTPVFLKRTFTQTHNGLRALLDKMSLRRQALWVKGSLTTQIESPVRIDRTERTAQLQAVLTHASQHGPEFYKEIAELVKKNNEVEGLEVMIDYHCSDIEYQCWYNGSIAVDTLDNRKLVFEMEGNRPDGRPALGPATAMEVAPPDNVVATTQLQNVVAQPVAPTQAAQLGEVVMATGALVTGVPLEVTNAFVLTKQLTWNSSQGTMSLLGSFPVGPASNPYLAHLSTMWTAWAGGTEFRISISGSGIFGGRLMCAILPPGINPTTVVNPGAFPHILVDARSSEPAVFSLSDIRNVDFHLIDGTDPTVTLGVWVYNSLINPFAIGTTSTAFVSIETRPTRDFAFAMLRPPGTFADTGLSPGVLLPKKLSRCTGVRAGCPIIGLFAAGQVSLTNGHFNAGGVTYGWSYPTGRDVVVDGGTSVTGALKVRPVVAGSDSVTLVSGIPSGFPDWAASTLNSAGMTTPTTLIGACCSALRVDTSSVLTTGICPPVVAAVGSTQNNTTVALSSGLSSSNMIVTSPENGYSVPSGQLSLSNPFIFNSALVGATGLQLLGTSRTATAFGANNACVWVESVTSSTTGSGVVYSSQLTRTAEMMSTGLINIPSGSMAVFNVEAPSASFQVGIGAEGYLFINAPTGTTITLGSETTFTFAGLFPVTTPLTMPPNVGGSGVSV
nr:polyprotein [Bat sapovirus BtSY1]